MNAIQLFDFESNGVRISLDEMGQPWWVAVDVCRALQVANTSDAVGRVPDQHRRGVDIADPIGRKQKTTVINQAGLWRLILSGRTEAAERFTDWVTSEVLPSIARTGSYAAPGIDPAILADLHRKIDEQTRQLAWMAEALDSFSLYLAGMKVRPMPNVGAPRARPIGEPLPPSMADPAVYLAERTTPGDRVSAIDLYGDYLRWAADRMLRPVETQRFGATLNHLGYHEFQHKGHRYRHGLNLAPQLPGDGARPRFALDRAESDDPENN